MIKRLSAFDSKIKQQGLLTILWLLVQGVLFARYGIQPILESLKYIGAANYLIDTGHLPELRYYFYLTTTLVIASCLKAGLGYSGVVAIQLLANLIATHCFFNALYRLQQKPYSAFITTLLLLLCIPFQTWNFYLYTESLFYSAVLMFFSYCIAPRPLSFKTIATSFLLLALVIVSRPLGILFLPCWIVYLIEKSPRELRITLIVASVTSAVVFVLISNFILGNISDWGILTSAEYQEIICDVPGGLRLNLDVFKSKPPVAQLVSYISTYPQQFGLLALKRLRAFLGLTRPYYSFAHNLLLGFTCLLLYVPIVLNAWFYKRKPHLEIIAFPVSIILFYCTAICLQCDDFHNRFQLSITPVFLYAGVFLLLEKRPFINYGTYKQ